MEAGAWRRLPEAQALQVAGSVCGVWCPDRLHERGHALLSAAGGSVPGAPRRFAAVLPAALHLYGLLRWLCVLATLQDLQRCRLEADDPADRLPVPGDLLRDLLYPEFAHLGPTLFWGSALHHHVRHALLVVRGLGTLGLPGRLLRLPQGQHRVARENESDPAADSGAVVVHEARVHHPRGRCLTLRCSLHRALLHHVIHMATPVLLPLWIPGASAGNPLDHLCRDRHGLDLLSAHRGGLQLVVEILPLLCIFRALRLHVCHPVL